MRRLLNPAVRCLVEWRMWEFILELLKTLGTTAIVVGAAAWLTKSVITHFLSRKIEAYKIELKGESDKKIEEVKSRLQIMAQERQIIFSRLHEKRAEIVADSYTLIHEVHSKAVGLGADIFHGGLRAPKERAKEVFDDCLKFNDFFQQRRIYFSEEVCTMTDRFVELIGETNAAVSRAPDNLDFSNKDGQEAYRQMADLMDRLPQIKKLIEKDFRTLLGVIAPDERASNNS
jgi:hypothetical protein